ncbi:MAG: tetratricopeptide repeat protein [Mycobacteriales bacterium]
MLDPDIRRDLRSLSKDGADLVARHLVAAGQLIDEDPAAAYRHALAARATAGRLGVVREAVGVTAYAAGQYAEALAELRAARRISGSPEHLPLMADCERALGRPERALDAGRDPDAPRLDRAAAFELLIVVSGARRDLGQVDAAVLSLQGPQLSAGGVDEPALRLRYAYADALLAAGRTAQAREQFLALAADDEDGSTDALDRLAELDAAATDGK